MITINEDNILMFRDSDFTSVQIAWLRHMRVFQLSTLILNILALNLTYEHFTLKLTSMSFICRGNSAGPVFCSECFEFLIDFHSKVRSEHCFCGRNVLQVYF